MSGRSVARGKAWERQVARDLTAATGEPFERVLRESRDGNVGDVRGPGIVVQAKAGAAPSVWAALAEAQDAAGPGDIPVAAVKRTHGRGIAAERFAAVPWESFLELVARTGRGSQP